MPPRAALALVEFEGDFSKIDRQTGQSAKTVEKSFGSSFKNIARNAALAFGTIFATKQIIDFGKATVGAASDQFETINKVKVVLGDASDAVLEWSKTSATALGQSRTQALDAAASFSVFGKSAGLTGPKLAGFSTDLVGLSADLASFSNTSPADAIEAIGAALRGESEPIRKYGILLNDASLKQRALALGLVKTTKEALTPQVRVLAAQAEIFAQTSDAQGDFARTSDGLANKQRILAAQFADFKANIGKFLLPLILKLTGTLGGLASQFQILGKLAFAAIKVGFSNKSTAGIHGWLKAFATVGVVLRNFADFIRDVVVPQLIRLADFFERNWHTIRDVGIGVINALMAVFRTLLPIIIDLGRGIAAFVGFLRQNQDVAVALAAVIGTLVAAFITLQIIEGVRALVVSFRLAMLALNSSFLANPIVLVAAALVALVAGVVLAYRHFKIFHDAVDTAWQILQTTFHWVQHNWPLLLAILTGPFGLAVRFIIQHWSGILSFFKGIPAAIGGFLKTVATTVTAPFRAAFNAIAKLWNNTVGKLSFKIPSWVPGIGGKGFSVPKIPTLHTGGIFDAAGGQGLALLKSGEGVFTPSQMKAMGSSGPSVVTNVWGNVYGDSHLRKIFDDHDQKLVSQLAVGHR